MSDVSVGKTFGSFDEAKTAISEFCSTHFHPIRTDKRESVRSYNARVGEQFRITALHDDDIFSYRYVYADFLLSI